MVPLCSVDIVAAEGAEALSLSKGEEGTGEVEVAGCAEVSAGIRGKDAGCVEGFAGRMEGDAWRVGGDAAAPRHGDAARHDTETRHATEETRHATSLQVARTGLLPGTESETRVASKKAPGSAKG